MNRGEIRQAVISALNEQDGSAQWPVPEIDRYIDDWYREMAEMTDSVVTTVSIVCPAKAFFIDLPANVLSPFAARDLASGLPIDPVHWTYIDQKLDKTWRRSPGQTRPDCFAAWGLHKILLFPPYASGGTIQVDACAIESLASDGVSPAIPLQHHDGGVEYVIAQCLEKNADEQRMGRARRRMGEFGKSIEALKEWGVSRNAGIAAANYGEAFRGLDYP